MARHNIILSILLGMLLLICGCGGTGLGASKDSDSDRSVPVYDITATAGSNGSIAPSGTQSVDEGDDITFTITPDANYYVEDVLVDGQSVGQVNSYTFTNVSADHTISASFNRDYDITATAGPNGSIDPSGTRSVTAGDDITFTITPDADYYIVEILLDGSYVGRVSPYTISNVSSNHTVSVSFDTENVYVAMGDSITDGFGDDVTGDDTSQDGKNTGGGFTPILNDLLTVDSDGFPHDIVNEGSGGDTSVDGRDRIATVLAAHPDAKKWLVNYGMNDSYPLPLPIPSGQGLNPGDGNYPGTYKDNMQQIVDAINNAGKEVCLSKTIIALGDFIDSGDYADPDSGRRSETIKEYNVVVDELFANPANSMTVIPPDFYTYFKEPSGSPRYETQYSDNIHPNGIGYQSMADLWFQALTP